MLELTTSGSALKMRAPNGETRVQPATIFFPVPHGHSIYAHEDVRLAQSDEFTAVDERAQPPALSKMHGDGVHLGV